MTMPWRLRAVDKDLRALLPTWCVFALTIAVAASGLGPSGALFVYLLGCALLGALIVGHEFSHRTLPALLTLPIDRRQLLLAKLAILAIMLAGLAVVASACGITAGAYIRSDLYLPQRPGGATALLLPALCGLCLAPWLTLIGRSPLAGAVFSCATVCTMWFAGEVIGAIKYGMGTSNAGPLTEVRTAVAWNGTLLACVAGAVGTWISFVRLQASDNRSLSIDVGRWLAPAKTRAAATSSEPLPGQRRHWVWMLAIKEVRLQVPALVIGGLYVLAWCGITSSRSLLPEHLRLPLDTVTPLFGVILGLVVGSFASAEERHLGTFAWQGLMPVAAWRQWTVKLLAALALALVVGVGLPLTLQVITPGLSPYYDFMPKEQPIIVLLATIGSLYVSSLSGSGLRAIVASIAVAAAGAWMLTLPLILVINAATSVFLPVFRSVGWFRNRVRTDVIGHPEFTAAIILVLFVVGYVLWLAMINHRSAERGRRQLRTQVVWLVCIFLLSGSILGAVKAANVWNWRYVEKGGVHLTGRFVFEGSTPPPTPEQLRDSWIYLRPEDDRWDSGINGDVIDGRVTTPDFYPDRYRILALGGSIRKTWTFRGATYQGRDITDTSIDIQKNLDDVVFTFTDHPGTLSGRVQNADGSSGLGAVVLLFPVDRSAWTPYDWSSRLVRASGLSPDRSEFTWTMPPDNEYFLVAVPRDAVRGVMRSRGGGGAELIIEKDPAPLFASLIPLADRIQAREGRTVTVNLTVKQVK